MGVGEPRVRTRQAPDVRRTQLLDAARELVVERGVRSTTMAAVAEAAGVAKGTTYLYFASKEELVDALRADYLDDFATALRSGDDASPTERLDRFVDGLFRFAADHHALHHALIHDAGTCESDAMAGAQTILEPIVTAGASDGSFAVDPDDTGTTTTFLLHGIHAAVVTTLHDTLHAPRAAQQPVVDIDPATLDRAVTQVTATSHRVVGATAT